MEDITQALLNAEHTRNLAAIAQALDPSEGNLQALNTAQESFLRITQVKKDLYPAETESDSDSEREDLPPANDHQEPIESSHC